MRLYTKWYRVALVWLQPILARATNDWIRLNLPHEMVDHKALEYVRGEVHTNNIESFWSLLKRGIVGTFHQVSADYLPLYLNEFTFRHNFRNEPDQFRQLISSVH
ncbi:MAG: transposase [Candidatus Binataceae bacterium]